MSFLHTQRLIWTYAPEGRNLGVVTGYEHDGLFVVEHLIALPGTGCLLRLIPAGLEEAWVRGYRGVVFCLPNRGQGRPYSTLAKLVRRYGCEPYTPETDRALTWWVRWK